MSQAGGARDADVARLGIDGVLHCGSSRAGGHVPGLVRSKKFVRSKKLLRSKKKEEQMRRGQPGADPALRRRRHREAEKPGCLQQCVYRT